MFRLSLNITLSLVGMIFIVACKPTAQKQAEHVVIEAKANSIDACVEAKDDRKVKLDLIQQLMDQGKLFAALAHLDAIRSQSPRALYLRAEILRRTDRSEQAAQIYRDLVRGCMAGKGYHGLGLIAGKKNNVVMALGYLQKAARELPLDVRVRNDFGYALLLDGQYDLARNEFMTAMELSGGDELAITNLALLLLLTGTEEDVLAFAVRMGIDDDAMNQLRTQAEGIRTVIESGSNADGRL